MAPNLRRGAALAFAHGFSVHFSQVEPPKDNDVFMVAPKGPGHLVRRMYTTVGAFPAFSPWNRTLQDTPGTGTGLRLRPRRRQGGVLCTTFAEETETDLFGEQAVLCGGITELIKAGFDTLVEAGTSPKSPILNASTK